MTTTVSIFQSWYDSLTTVYYALGFTTGPLELLSRPVTSVLGSVRRSQKYCKTYILKRVDGQKLLVIMSQKDSTMTHGSL